MLCFFFFKQKTAYEMRISDWSSDVCSSDLVSTSFSLRRSISKRRAIIFCKQLVDLDDQVVAFEPDMEIAVFESLCAEKLAFSDPRFAFQTGALLVVRADVSGIISAARRDGTE